MSVYFVTGKLGSGKTLFTIDVIQTALCNNQRVATNLDLKLENLVMNSVKTEVIRLPDKPRLIDLELIGAGYSTDEKYDEKKFGVIVLDELGTWFNTRNYHDKERLPLINWFLHARKMRWHVYFIVQHIDAIDKQLRDALCEHLVVCSRADRLKFFGFIKPPQIHLARVYYGDSETCSLVDRIVYKSKNLWDGYDTEQVFTDDLEIIGNSVIDMRASYSLLPPSYFFNEEEDKSINFFRSLFYLLLRLPLILSIYIACIFDAESRIFAKRHGLL